MTLSQIKNSPDYLNLINNFLKSNPSSNLGDIINYCHGISIELRDFCKVNESLFPELKPNDKGSLGKAIEFYIFGTLPNSNTGWDLGYGDLKVTNFRKLQNGLYNAKERLTITNLGDPSKPGVIEEVTNKNSLKETKFYNKISKGIVIFCLYEKVDNTLSQILKRRILGIVQYDINDFSQETISQIDDDFLKIKNCLLDGRPTQKGQKYLHLHKHGSKGDNHRAFGFTNKFLTRLVADALGLTLIEKGNSLGIQI
jgi:hypothetical protein